MFKVQNLRCEFQSAPVGVIPGRPRFSWEVYSDQNSTVQAAWALEVAADTGFHSPVWQTGKTNGDAAVLVPYGGQALAPSTRYYARVCAWDNHGEESAWSDMISFVTCMDGDGWQAAFITAETDADADRSAGSMFRREFAAKGPVKAAYLYATAKGVYELYLNGARVGDTVLAPGWTEYHKRLLYQTYDVTDMVRQDGNALGAMVGTGWYKGDLAGGDPTNRNMFGGRTALLAQLVLVYGDGTSEVVATGEGWQCRKSPVTYTEIYHGECYDARLEQPGWAEAGFTGTGWGAAEIESTDLSAVIPQDGPLVTRHEEFEPVSMFTTPGGDRVIDFGQNLSGLVRFRVRGEAGDRVVLRHAETLDAAGNFYTDNLRSARQRLEYTLKGGGEECYEAHHTFYGFRYIAIDEFPGEPAAESFRVFAVYSDMRPIGAFECSHPLVNQLISNVKWGMKSNFVDIPTDCPQRDERLGWTGDAQVFVRAASYLMETAPFFEKWLRDVACSQYENGGVTHVSPNILYPVDLKNPHKNTDHGACGWGDVAVVAPWTIYKYFGDRAVLETQYPSMKAWVQYITDHSQDGALWNTGFHFGDWVALDAEEGSYFGATPNELTATAFYANSVRLMVKTADVLGNSEDKAYYTALHERIVKAFQKEFFDAGGDMTAKTQTAHILALCFGLVPEGREERTVAALVELIRQNGGYLTTGFLGTPFLLYALSEHGRLDEAYRMLLLEDYPSWLYQITKGATTIWEHWDGLKPDGTMWSTDMNSFNHYAYGAVADWVFSVVGGLDTDDTEVGYRRLKIAPRPGPGIDWAKTSMLTPYGPAAVSWACKAGDMTVDITIPTGARATVTLPGARADDLGEDFTACGRDACADLGSGVYRFQYAMA